MQTLKAAWPAAALSLAVLTLVACSDSTLSPNPDMDAPSSSVAGGNGSMDRGGAVYTLTNAAAGNGVIAFRRATDGALTPIGTFATGGLGIGGAIDPLASQYAVVLTDQHDALFAVDAGSDDIASFRVSSDGSLTPAGVVASGGSKPVSLAVHGNLLYALNTGDNTLSGFRITGGARLVALPNTHRALTANADGAAAVRFTRDGRFLIVSERVSNRLEVFPVDRNGRLGTPVVTESSGSAAFGFDVTSHNQPIVSETQGSVTSYALASDGSLTPITASISTGGKAACWVIITADGHYAYTTNAGSNFVSGFSIASDGSLTALTPGVATGDAGTGATPIDLDQVGGRFLYTLEAGRGAIGTFMIGSGGALTARADTPAGLPSSGMQGLAAY